MAFDLNQIRMPSELLLENGINMLIYGRAGTGKTRSALTAPKPLLWAIENGLLSLQSEQIPVVQLPIQENINDAVTKKGTYPFACIDDFIDWCVKQTQYETIIVDSLSELTTVIFSYYSEVEKNIQRAYGLMADDVIKWIKKLYYAKCNTVLICKEKTINRGTKENPIEAFAPSFAGQLTATELSHLVDYILRIDKKAFQVNGKFEEYNVFCTQNKSNYAARDRSGKLAEYELVDNGLSYLMNKSKGLI